MTDLHDGDFARSPHINKGVISAKQNGLEAIIDWVQVTFKDTTPKGVIEEVLKIPVTFFKEFEYGRFYYDRSMQHDKMIVYWSTKNSDMGTHLYLTGSACRSFEYYLKGQNRTWQAFFEHCLERGGTFSRIDVAIDDRKTYFKVGNLGEKLEKGELVTRFQKSKRFESFETIDGKNAGKTVYLGSEKSNVMVRIYEKNYEQASKLNCSPENFGDWNRIEIRVRDTHAEELSKLLCEKNNLSHLILSILNNSVRFVTKPKASKDKDKRRWKIYKPWSQFINNASKVSLSMKPEIKSIEDNIDWLCKQVATTLDTVLTAEAMAQSEGLLEDTDFLNKILAHSTFADEHTQRINQYLEELKRKKNLS